MLISANFLKNLCPAYRKRFIALQRRLKATKNPRIKKYYLEAFSEKYMMPRKYWKILLDYDFYSKNQKSHAENYKLYYQLITRAIYQFLYDHRVHQEGGHNENFEKLMNFWAEKYPNVDNVDPKDINFPHFHIKYAFYLYESYRDSLPPFDVTKKYQKMKKLYDEIMAAENDVEKWFKLLLEVEDDEFVIHNVEYRIGTNLLDKTLWKLYINFLKETNPKLMLHTFSKYCRFFLDDKEMLEKYKLETAKYGPINLEWKNLFDFEKKGNGKIVNDKANETQRPSRKLVHSQDELQQISKTISTYFFETFMNQNFILPKPIIFYILEKANHIVLRKLFASCKYFFAKKQTPICYKFEANASICKNLKTKYGHYDFLEESFQIYHWIDDSKNFNMIKNFHITTFLNAGFSPNRNPRLFSQIISKLYKCDAKDIYISYQNLYYKEFKFLVGNGNVKLLNLKNVKIEREEENLEEIFLEDITALLPNFKILIVEPLKVNQNTAKNLVNQKALKKFATLNFYKVFGEPFNPIEFRNYCIKNGEKHFQLDMTFDRTFKPGFSKELEKVMKDSKYFSKKTRNEMWF